MAAVKRFGGMRAAIAGFGVEGRSAAEFLAEEAASVTVFDNRPEVEFPKDVVARLRAAGAEFCFGAFGPFDDFDTVVRSPGISPSQPALHAAMEKGIRLTSATQIFLDLCPCAVIGVTGTKGKGTTSSLLHQMLVAGGKDAHLCGNIGAPALDFLPTLTKDSVAVYEMSSFQLLDLSRSPQLAIVLMITADHLDFHKTREDYLQAKSNILRFQSPDDMAIVNIDHAGSRALLPFVKGDLMEVSRRSRVAAGAYAAGDAVFLAHGGEARALMPVADVPLAGAHNLENVCAAAAAASHLGVPDPVIAAAVRAFAALPHRLQFVREVDGVRYFDDSIGTTPDSALAAFAAFSEPKVMVLGGSGKGADWTELAAALGAAAENGALAGVVGIGEEWPRIREALAAHWPADAADRIAENIYSMKDAVAAARRLAPKGSVVLLSPGCASFGMFKDYKDRGDQFAAAVNAL